MIFLEKKDGTQPVLAGTLETDGQQRVVTSSRITPRMEAVLVAPLSQASILYSPLGCFLIELFLYSDDQAAEGCWKVCSRLGLSRHVYVTVGSLNRIRMYFRKCNVLGRTLFHRAV